MIPRKTGRVNSGITAKYARGNLERALVIAAIVLVNLAALSGMGPTYEAGLGAFLFIAVIRRAWGPVHFLLLFFLMSGLRDVLPGLTGQMPSVRALAPLAASTLVMLAFRKREAIGWLRTGRADGVTIAIGIAASVASFIALLVWASFAPSLGEGPAMVRRFSALFPAWTILAFGAPLFAFVNAFSEEAVYRGLSQAAIGEALGPWPGLVLQATLYAAAHFTTGFPNGYAGYAMTFFYGSVLGYMRMRSGGLKAPYLAHVAADLTIGYYLAFKFL